MKRFIRFLGLLAMSVGPALADVPVIDDVPVVVDVPDKLTLGWIEPVRLDPRLGLELEAKLDTGADTSSLDARDIRRVRVGDKSYVRFSIRDPATDEVVELRKPYLRRIRIKRHGGNFQRRYVVRMKVCIGGHTRSIDVNLIDRANFDYPMLLGRSALQGWAIVDPEISQVTQPTCWGVIGDGMPMGKMPDPDDGDLDNDGIPDELDDDDASDAEIGKQQPETKPKTPTPKPADATAGDARDLPAPNKGAEDGRPSDVEQNSVDKREPSSHRQPIELAGPISPEPAGAPKVENPVVTLSGPTIKVTPESEPVFSEPSVVPADLTSTVIAPGVDKPVEKDPAPEVKRKDDAAIAP